MTKNDPTITPVEGRLISEAREHRGEARECISPLGVLNVVLRYLPILIVLPLLTGLFAALLGVFSPPTYEASSTFAATAESGPTGEMASMANRFGLSFGGGGGVGLPFYAELLRSRELLIQVAHDQYEFEVDGEERTGTLMEALQLEGTERGRLNQAIGFVRSSMSLNLKRDPGVMELEVEALDPGLAEAVNRRLLEVLQEFSLERRRQQAAAERGFLEGRLEQAAQELRDAEEAVTRFLKVNRHYEGSPELTNELTQLRRRVDIRQGVYMSLATALDQAQLQEARDLPSITVVARPEGTANRNDLSAGVNAVLGVILGLVAGFLFILVREYAQSARRNRPAEYAEMQAHLRRLGRHLPLSGRGARPRS